MAAITPERAGAEPTKFGFIDAARGYAILLVMITHSLHPNLPHPIHRVAKLGWHGVQLFFVVSALTLALSWHARQGREANPGRAFIVRRLFRIAPMYVLAFFLYLLLQPPGEAFSWLTAFTTLTFLNGWSPYTMSTSTTGWSAVPGGWSVAVEFGLYILFPLLIVLVSSLRRALLAIAISLVVAVAANALGMAFYEPTYGAWAMHLFLYYWLPNQMPVFLLGFLAYFLLTNLRQGGAWQGAGATIARWATPIAALGFLAFASLGFTTIPRLPSLLPPVVPIHVVASFCFLAIVVALGLGRHSLFVNTPMIWLGRVSFSAYLLHFAVIDLSKEHLPGLWNLAATDYLAIAHTGVGLGFVVLATFAVSYLAYRLVEMPMVSLGHGVARRVGGRPGAAVLQPAAAE